MTSLTIKHFNLPDGEIAKGDFVSENGTDDSRVDVRPYLDGIEISMEVNTVEDWHYSELWHGNENLGVMNPGELGEIMIVSFVFPDDKKQ